MHAGPAPAQPAPVTPAATGKRHGSGGISLAGAVLLVGVVALMLFKALTWPLLLALLAVAFFVQQAERGRAEQALRTLITVGALVVVLMNPKFGPGMKFLFTGANMLGR
jgi:hypothetical protein